MKICGLIDVRAPRHRKLVNVGIAGRGLWMDALLYAKELLTDGVISDAFVAAKGPEAQECAKRLVESGAWERIEGGYKITSYLEHNPSREEVEQKERDSAERRAAAGRHGGLTKALKTSTKTASCSKRLAKASNAKQKLATSSSSSSTTSSNKDLPSGDLTRARATPPDVPDDTPAPKPKPASERYAEAWAEGISKTTGSPCSPPSGWSQGDIARAIQAHSAGQRGEDLINWLRDSASSYAESKHDDAHFGGFSPKKWLAWLDSGAPRFRPQGNRIVQQPAAKFEGSWEDYARGYKFATMPNGKNRRIEVEDDVPWLDERDRLKAAKTPATQEYFETWLAERKRQRKEAGILTEAEKLQIEREKRWASVTPIRKVG